MIRRAILGLVVIAGRLLAGAAPAAASPTILGAGSTWSQIALDQWRYDVVSQGLTVNYQGVGSTQGRQFFAAGTVDFAVSEIPFQDGEPVNRAFKYLPIVAGGTSMMYNVPGPGGDQVRNLRLSPPTIAGIFTGQITNWNDKRITADYGSKLPSLPIKAIVRSDGSGTSAQFSAYIADTQSGTWSAFAARCGIADTYTSFWPYGSGCLANGIGQRGSDGVANYIANPGLGVGAIGYVEAGYAIARRFPVVAVKNASGHFVYPTATNVATALQHATLHSDSTSDLSKVYSASEATAYPISSYSYMIVPTDGSISPDKGKVLGQFIIYFACRGQQEVQKLGYSPLPKALVEFAFAAEKAIPGAPAPPAVTGAACPNPTLTGDFYNQQADPTFPGTEPQPDPTNTDPGSDPSDPSSGPKGPDPSGTADPGATTTDTGTITMTASPSVLSSEEQARLQRLARERIAGTGGGSAKPLAGIAIALLALVFGPLFVRMRSGRG